MLSHADAVLAIILLSMIVVSLRNLTYVIWNINYFLEKRRYSLVDNPTKFFIIVPLMYEAHTVSTLIRSLNRLKYPRELVEVVFVTTIRERDSAGRNPTHAAVSQYIETKAKKHPQDFNLRVIESPIRTGYVATQNNFAINSLKNEIAKDDFIVFYNADSAPDKNTLLAASLVIRKQGQKAQVLQQSSLFTKNLRIILRNKQFGAAANAIHQSLWTLKHEVSMTRRQSRLSVTVPATASSLYRFLRTRFTVCVGHGLFVRKSYYDIHPLNEDANIEDTQYGLYQSLERTPVFTVPVLENSESPSTLRKVTSQKRGWFKLVFDLARLLAQRKRSVFKSKEGRSEFVSIVVQVLGIYLTWFMHSVFIVGTLLWALASGEIVLVLLWLVFYVLYWLFPAALLAVNQKRLIKDENISISHIILVWIAGSTAIMSHSLGAWLAVHDKILGEATRIKTER